MKDPNDYIGSVFVWDKEKVNGIMQDIVNFIKYNERLKAFIIRIF
jgi:hypothetical protein